MGADNIADQCFWNDASTFLEGSIPLIHSMDWMKVDEIDKWGASTKNQPGERDEQPESKYLQFWKVIDQVWKGYLYNHLNSTCYYLNLNIFYADKFLIFAEIPNGVFSCLVHSVHDQLAISWKSIKLMLALLAPDASVKWNPTFLQVPPNAISCF